MEKLDSANGSKVKSVALSENVMYIDPEFTGPSWRSGGWQEHHINVKHAQAFVCLLYLRERIEVRGTGMASFIIRGGIFAMPVKHAANVGSSDGVKR